MDRLVTTMTADADLYVDTCLSRSLEALGVDAASEVDGAPIPIEFEEPPPVTVRISRRVLVVSTPTKDHRIALARVAVVVCALVSIVSAGVALAKSPVPVKQLARAASVDLSRR